MVHIRCGCDFPIVPLFLAPSQVPDNTDSGFRSYWASLLFLQKAFWLSWPPNRCIPFFCTSLGTLPRTKRLIHLSCQTVSFKLALFKVRSGILLVHLGSSLGDDRAILVIQNIKFLSVYDDIKTQFFLPVHLTKNTKIHTVCQVFPVRVDYILPHWLHTTTIYFHTPLPAKLTFLRDQTLPIICSDSLEVVSQGIEDSFCFNGLPVSRRPSHSLFIPFRVFL